MAIVFDTYAWIEYFNATKKGVVVKNYLEEDDVITPAIVLLELSYRADQEGWNFNQYLSFIKANSKIIGINEKFILTFGKLYNEMKKQVRDISLADIVVINTAILHDAQILTGDEHFKKINRAIMLE
ncbi:PIN domain-containing protein [Candidatus Pacearchaeota archaeon]|nr:PIN domain-containing protein [Candidatus Pacearchaeota archaeon]